mmetsp:Transcript_18629/g.46788  ORF Transcript_18629/g.46788 Transcript_18629/m.46788 type:complete len:312 (-) Transcript_18629:1022-1957(-)
MASSMRATGLISEPLSGAGRSSSAARARSQRAASWSCRAHGSDHCRCGASPMQKLWKSCVSGWNAPLRANSASSSTSSWRSSCDRQRAHAAAPRGVSSAPPGERHPGGWHRAPCSSGGTEPGAGERPSTLPLDSSAALARTSRSSGSSSAAPVSLQSPGASPHAQVAGAVPPARVWMPSSPTRSPSIAPFSASSLSVPTLSAPWRLIDGVELTSISQGLWLASSRKSSPSSWKVLPGRKPRSRAASRHPASAAASAMPLISASCAHSAEKAGAPRCSCSSCSVQTCPSAFWNALVRWPEVPSMLTCSRPMS